MEQTKEERNRERYESMSNKRFEDETFEEYKDRRRVANQLMKDYLKGMIR